MTRFKEHQKVFKEVHGISKIDIDILASVEGKDLAKQLELRYIKTYEKIYGQRPPYNFANH